MPNFVVTFARMGSLAGALVSALATVAPPAAAQESVYVRLYTERVNVNRAAVVRNQAEAEFQRRRLDRATRLLASSAISREEYESILAESQKSTAEVAVAQALVGEAEATLDVVKALLATGQPVPLCERD